jgi:IclR family transcriptional regulator, KDG regulon repressor
LECGSLLPPWFWSPVALGRQGASKLAHSKGFAFVKEDMYQAPIVKKAFQVLELIARNDRRMNISDISRELGMSKGTVHGITHALEEAGAVVRDEDTKSYSLGLVLFELARKAYSRIELKDIARPFMEELMRKTRQSVFLGMRSHDRVIIIDIVESTQDLKITAPVGARIPLLVGALGKVFMAGMKDGDAAKWIRTAGLRRDTENSIADPDRYLREIERTKKSGYAVDDEEYIQGVRAVAAPIRAAGRPMAAIWVVGFTQSISSEKLAIVAGETKRAAEAIANKIDSRSMEGKGR